MIGSIAMWSGVTPPAGWVLCDGNNGSPNLQDRFVVGAGSSYSLGNTGGANSITLITAEMPVHNHTSSGGLTSSSGSHVHSGTLENLTLTRNAISGGGGGIYSSSTFAFTRTNSGGAHVHSVTGNSTSAGSGNAHENRPPYYVLAFIMAVQ